MAQTPGTTFLVVLEFFSVVFPEELELDTSRPKTIKVQFIPAPGVHRDPKEFGRAFQALFYGRFELQFR